MNGGPAELTGYPLAGLDGAIGRVVSTLDPDGYCWSMGCCCGPFRRPGRSCRGFGYTAGRPGRAALSARPVRGGSSARLTARLEGGAMSQAAAALGRGFDERIPVVLVLDTSASMGRPEQAPRIVRLTAALGEWFTDASAQPGLRGRFEIAIITFDSAINVLDPGGRPDICRRGGGLPADRRRAPAPVAGRRFQPDAAGHRDRVRLATERKRLLEADGIPSRRPLIWLLTDGAPSDENGTALAPADLAGRPSGCGLRRPPAAACSSRLASRAGVLRMLEVLAPTSTMMLGTFSYREILRFVSRSSDDVKSSDSPAEVYLRTKEQVDMLAEISSLEETI